jgi:hypothetical protein
MTDTLIAQSRPTRCISCGRDLTDPDSVRRGIGPDCWKKLGGIGTTLRHKDNASSDVLLALDWDTMNIRLYKEPRTQRVSTNVPHLFRMHSPSGFAWGYGGSGPADLALNILHLFLPVTKKGKRRSASVAVGKGPRCSYDAWNLHQLFKREIIEPLDWDANHVIPGDRIREWLREQGVEPTR